MGENGSVKSTIIQILQKSYAFDDAISKQNEVIAFLAKFGFLDFFEYTRNFLFEALK